MKTWNTGSPSPTVHICRALLIANSLNLVFGVIRCTLQNCTLRNFAIFKTQLFSQFSFDSSKLHTMYSKHTGYYPFLAVCQKLTKLWGILKFFLTKDYMQREFQSAISPTIFIGAHPNFMRTLVTMVNPNAC